MRLKLESVFCLLILGLLLSAPVAAQKRSKYTNAKFRNKKISNSVGRSGKFRPYEFLGVGLNAFNYYGDLAPLARAASTDVSFTRPGLGFTYGYRFHPQSAIRVNYNYGRIIGDDITSQDPGRYARNLSFRNNINELNVGFNFYFLPDLNSSTFRNPFNIYLFVGAGFFYHEPKGQVPQYDYQTFGPTAAAEGAPELDQAGEWVRLRELNTEGQGSDLEGAPAAYKPFQWQIPINLGAMFSIPKTPFNLHIEFGYRFIFTDYLDDVSNNYAGLDRFDNDLARIMSDRSAEPFSGFGDVERDLPRVVSQSFNDGSRYFIAGDLGGGIDGSIRGNPDSNDVYFVTQVKLTYNIPPSGFDLFKKSSGKRKTSAKFR
ncbi:MAG: hypothetical protein ACI8QD_000998 [Cyclobacteriaceae bacterium]|jgi:hypothetical protein